jgi:hypothetical protein
MPEQPCSNAELTSRIVALEANLAALRDVLTERDIRYSQRAAAQDDAVRAALDTSKEAITKAEAATERRLETLNELRGVVVDQARDFARKAEVQLLVDGMEKRIETITRAVSARDAHGLGVKDAIGWAVGAIGLIGGFIVSYYRH